MGLFVKICGLTSAEAVDGVVALKPDAVGFVFWPGSKRYVTAESVADWCAEVPPTILKVGVFVDADRTRISETADAAGLDVIQLHGEGAAAVCGDLPYRTWRVVHLDRMSAEEVTSNPVDAFLVDSYSTESPGGTGRVCDWAAARRFVASMDTPVVLAGGLTPDNVAEAAREVQPWGVDVSSGVERVPGEKDLEKVKAFIERCRNL